MKITTRGRYALQLLVDLAEHYADEYVPLADAAARQGISKNYLEQIALLLRQERLLETALGKSGGYRLAYPPANYRIGDIMLLTEGSVKPSECVDECSHGSGCKTLKVWRGLDRVMSGYLNSITLQDILDDSEMLHCD